LPVVLGSNSTLTSYPKLSKYFFVLSSLVIVSASFTELPTSNLPEYGLMVTEPSMLNFTSPPNAASLLKFVCLATSLPPTDVFSLITFKPSLSIVNKCVVLPSATTFSNFPSFGSQYYVY
jgi:hypothetical protein